MNDRWLTSTRRGAFFLGVGLVSSAAYIATMSIGIEVLRLSVLASALAAFCAGTAVSYVGNTCLTFRRKASVATLGRFLLVVFVGMGLNQAIAFVLDRAGVHYVLIALAVFVIVPMANYLGHSLFTYAERNG